MGDGGGWQKWVNQLKPSGRDDRSGGFVVGGEADSGMDDGTTLREGVAGLQEFRGVRQVPGDLPRRWFYSADFDLIVWFADGVIAGFELCYDKQIAEHSLLWFPQRGFAHMAIDDGENRPGKHKASPVRIPDGCCDIRRLHAAFAAACQTLPAEIADFVLLALEQHPEFGARHGGM